MNGFVNVIKPCGATASDVVVCLKHVLHQKKVGHLGTLDPGATGVLPIAVGSATKLFNFLTDKQKTYRAFFTFGKTTDTLDSYGVVTQTTGIVPALPTLMTAIKHLSGEIEQVPPAYSAISVGGVRAYKLARSGEEVQLKTRKVTVFFFNFVRQSAKDTFVFDITCSAGTYIRALARDLAVLCGTVGYMSALIRTQSGPFLLENAYTLDEIKQNGENCVVDIMFPLKSVEICVLPDSLFDYVSNGRKIPCPFADGYRKLYCKGKFFGLAKNNNGFIDLEYYLGNLND